MTFQDRINKILKVLGFVFAVAFVWAVFDKVRKLPLIVIVLLGIFIVGAFIALEFSVGFSKIVGWLYNRFRVRPFLTSVIVVGILLSVFCFGAYHLRNIEITQSNNLVNVSSKYYMKDGLFRNDYYLDSQITPSNNLKPDMTYNVKLGTVGLELNRVLSWTQAEVLTKYVKNIRFDLSASEYELVRKYGKLGVNVSLIKPEHNVWFIALPILYVVLTSLFWWIKNTYGFKFTFKKVYHKLSAMPKYVR